MVMGIHHCHLLLGRRQSYIPIHHHRLNRLNFHFL
jgi:hypothetical protein